MPYNLEPIEEDQNDLAARFGHDGEQDGTPLQRPDVSRDDVTGRTLRTEGVAERSASEKDTSYQQALQSLNDSDQSVDESAVAQDASDTHQKTNRDSQVQHLLDLALLKGVPHAIKVAQHTDDYYILDQVHDHLLLDDFRAALKERGVFHEAHK